MKLADSTIYNDGYLSIPTTENSIICARLLEDSDRSLRRFYVRDASPEDWLGCWYSTEIHSTSLQHLKDIVIIYRAPADGSRGPELIEDLHDLDEEDNAVEVIENFVNRVAKKIIKVAVAILESE